MKNEKTAKPKKKSRSKKVSVRVTYLEMTQHLHRHVSVPTRPIIALMRAQYIPADFYSFLYKMVGKPHHWQDRRNTPEAELYAVINDENCEIHVLYADGCPAGFFELDLSSAPESVELVYFGLGPEYLRYPHVGA